jgi:hypothetical protein
MLTSQGRRTGKTWTAPHGLDVVQPLARPEGIEPPTKCLEMTGG